MNSINSTQDSLINPQSVLVGLAIGLAFNLLYLKAVHYTGTNSTTTKAITAIITSFTAMMITSGLNAGQTDHLTAAEITSAATSLLPIADTISTYFENAQTQKSVRKYYDILEKANSGLPITSQDADIIESYTKKYMAK